MKHLSVISCLLLITSVIASCEREQSINQREGITMDERLLSIAARMDSIRNKKIFFGHQSVGNDVLEGLRLIAQEDSRFTVEIQSVGNGYVFDHPLLAHSTIGENGNPKSKCDDFLKKMSNGLGKQVDIAFFKFCFVDINAFSNPSELFKYYQETIEPLKSAFPNVQFIHVTVPLMTRPIGLRSSLKRLLNDPKPDLDNIRRGEFNNLLRAFYQRKEPLFDLAAVEATYPDGRKKSFTHHSKSYFSLINEYTTDGGHLNTRGQYLAAKELLSLLADISCNKKVTN